MELHSTDLEESDLEVERKRCQVGSVGPGNWWYFLLRLRNTGWASTLGQALFKALEQQWPRPSDQVPPFLELVFQLSEAGSKQTNRQITYSMSGGDNGQWISSRRVYKLQWEGGGGAHHYFYQLIVSFSFECSDKWQQY